MHYDRQMVNVLGLLFTGFLGVGLTATPLFSAEGWPLKVSGFLGMALIIAALGLAWHYQSLVHI